MEPSLLGVVPTAPPATSGGVVASPGNSRTLRVVSGQYLRPQGETDEDSESRWRSHVRGCVVSDDFLSYTLRVAGVTFVEGYPNNLLDLQACLEGKPADEHEPLELVREHDNAHDLNAILVRWRSRDLGHIPAHTARELAPAMDRGANYQARVEFVAVNLEHRDRPGLRIIVWHAMREDAS